jgi:hypothetical protein
MTTWVAIIHGGLAAAWAGGMTYSLFVVQPKLKKYFGPDEDSREALTTVIASGNRYKVLALIAAITATGLVLLLLNHQHWWIHALKTALLFATTTIFWRVSWHHWPHRLFATPTERPALQRQLHHLALTMLALTATAFALGIVATHL